MKKVVVVFCSVTLCFCGSSLAKTERVETRVATAASLVSVKAGPLVSVDSILMSQKSLEGAELAGQIKKEVDKFQGGVMKAQQELVKLQESISKQSKIFSKEALKEKSEELENKRKKLVRDFSGQERDLKESIEKRQINLLANQRAVINEVFKKNKWGLLVDKRTPGVLCVSSAIEKTDYVLQIIDEKFKESNTKKLLAEGSSRKKIVAA